MKNNKIILIIVGIILIIVFLFLFITGIGICKYKWQGKFVDSISKVIPYPAAMVNGKIIKYSVWREKINQYHSNKNFYLEEQEVDLSSLDLPSDEEVQQIALDDLIRKKIFDGIVKRNRIEASEEEIEQAYHDLILSQIKNGETSAEESLKQIYGMTIDEFKEQVITEYVLNNELEEIYNAQDDNILKELAKAKADDVYELAVLGEMEFEDLARMYSDDSLALLGGKVGYIGKGEMVEDYEKVFWNLEVGEIVQTSEINGGYFIVKVEDRRENEDETEVSVRHIFIKANINKLLESELEKANIWRLVY